MRVQGEKRRDASQPICENLRNLRFRQSRAIHFVYCQLNSQCSKHDLPLPLVCPQPIVPGPSPPANIIPHISPIRNIKPFSFISKYPFYTS